MKVLIKERKDGDEKELGDEERKEKTGGRTRKRKLGGGTQLSRVR